MDLVLVDGPNLFNVVGKQLATRGHGDTLRGYLTDWFDIDRLVRATLTLDKESEPGAPTLGTVIFHSSKALGSGTYRLDRTQTLEFWNRQGSLPQTSAVLVEIPGVQQETCGHCGQPDTSTREKGVDTSITSYMFETATSWTTLCLFAKDADYVPPVLSLRRQGKRVFVSHDNIDHAMALVRASQTFAPLNVEFLEADAAMFAFLRAGGGLDQVIGALGPLGCEVQVFFPKNMGASMAAMFGQVLEVDFDENFDMARLSATISAVIAATPGLDRETQLNPIGQGTRPRLVVGTRSLLGEALDRHVDVLGDAAWKRHLKPDATLL